MTQDRNCLRPDCSQNSQAHPYMLNCPIHYIFILQKQPYSAACCSVDPKYHWHNVLVVESVNKVLAGIFVSLLRFLNPSNSMYRSCNYELCVDNFQLLSQIKGSRTQTRVFSNKRSMLRIKEQWLVVSTVDRHRGDTFQITCGVEAGTELQDSQQLTRVNSPYQLTRACQCTGLGRGPPWSFLWSSGHFKLSWFVKRPEFHIFVSMA